MLYFFTPYSFEKRLFNAYDQYMNLVKDDDWVCFLDGDTAFLCPDFGHKIHEYIEKYPDTGLFTCLASRCHYDIQTLSPSDQANPNILYHKNISDILIKEQHLQVTEIYRRIAGHMMVIQKKTWMRIRGMVEHKIEAKKILGVDTKISYAVLNLGLKIRLMKSIYILHYLRMKEGFDYKEHLI